MSEAAGYLMSTLEANWLLLSVTALSVAIILAAILRAQRRILRELAPSLRALTTLLESYQGCLKLFSEMAQRSSAMAADVAERLRRVEELLRTMGETTARARPRPAAPPTPAPAPAAPQFRPLRASSLRELVKAFSLRSLTISTSEGLPLESSLPGDKSERDAAFAVDVYDRARRLTEVKGALLLISGEEAIVLERIEPQGVLAVARCERKLVMSPGYIEALSDSVRDYIRRRYGLRASIAES